MRIWIRVIVGLAGIAVLLWLLLAIGRFTLTVVEQFGGATGGYDPMFAAEATPEPAGAPVIPESNGRIFEDNSANWDVPAQTPVDSTADELAREAQKLKESGT